MEQNHFFRVINRRSLHYEIFLEDVSDSAAIQEEFFWTACPWKMGSISYPETSVTNYQSTLCNILEGIRSQMSLICMWPVGLFPYLQKRRISVRPQPAKFSQHILHYSGNFHFNIILPPKPIFLTRLLTSPFVNK
jgi:hypothetical protein